jgi:O-antigen/teichoic acid export membrane protein
MTKDYLIAALAQAIGVASAGTVTIVISRLLGPSGRGEYAVLSGLVQLLAMFGQAGFLAGAIQMGSRGTVPLGRLFRYAQIIPIVTGTLGSLALGLLLLRPDALGHPPVSACIVAMVLLPVLLASQMRAALLLALQRPSTYNKLFIAQQLVWVPCSTIASAVNPTSASALAGLLVSVLVWLSASTWQLRRHVEPSPWSELDRGELKRILTFGAQSTGGIILQLATSRVSLFIVSGAKGTVEAGIYSIATVLAEMLWQAVVAAAQVNLPSASAAYGRGERPLTVMLASRVAGALTLGAALLLAAVAPVIIPIVFSPAFGPAVLPLRILLVGTGVFGLCLLLTADLLARGHPHMSAIASGITLAITVPLCLMLVPRYGAAGAASATCVAYLVSTLTLVIVHGRMTGEHVSTLLMTTSGDVRVVVRAALRQLSHALGRD